MTFSSEQLAPLVQDVMTRGAGLVLDGWTQDVPAVDEAGTECSATSSFACKWCATGALEMAWDCLLSDARQNPHLLLPLSHEAACAAHDDEESKDQVLDAATAELLTEIELNVDTYPGHEQYWKTAVENRSVPRWNDAPSQVQDVVARTMMAAAARMWKGLSAAKTRA